MNTKLFLQAFEENSAICFFFLLNVPQFDSLMSRKNSKVRELAKKFLINTNEKDYVVLDRIEELLFTKIAKTDFSFDAEKDVRKRFLIYLIKNNIDLWSL